MNKKRVTIFCLIIGIFLVPQMATADEETLSQRWLRTYDGTGDGAWDVAAPDDDTVFTLGSSGSVLLRYDAAGNQLWRTSGIDGADAFALAYSIYDGGIYVAGGIADSALPGQTAFGTSDAYIIKYDGSGNVQWSRQFGTPDGEAVYDLAIDETGVYAVVSYALPALDATRPAVWKFDHAGQLVWMRPVFNATVDSAFAIDVSEDGVFIAGSSGSSAGLEFLSHAGVRQWLARLRQGSGFSVARAVAVE